MTVFFAILDVGNCFFSDQIPWFQTETNKARSDMSISVKLGKANVVVLQIEVNR